MAWDKTNLMQHSHCGPYVFTHFYNIILQGQNSRLKYTRKTNNNFSNVIYKTKVHTFTQTNTNNVYCDALSSTEPAAFSTDAKC